VFWTLKNTKARHPIPPSADFGTSEVIEPWPSEAQVMNTHRLMDSDFWQSTGLRQSRSNLHDPGDTRAFICPGGRSSNSLRKSLAGVRRQLSLQTRPRYPSGDCVQVGNHLERFETRTVANLLAAEKNRLSSATPRTQGADYSKPGLHNRASPWTDPKISSASAKPKQKAVAERKCPPGASTVEGYSSGLLGLSGRCCVSKQNPER